MTNAVLRKRADAFRMYFDCGKYPPEKYLREEDIFPHVDISARFACQMCAELGATKSFIGKSMQKKRKRVDAIPTTPMSAALVRTPTMAPTAPADPDTTQEFGFGPPANAPPEKTLVMFANDN